MRILLAVDGSKHSLNAVQFLIDHSDWLKDERNLAAAREKLDAAGVRYEVHTVVGSVAESLVKHAKDKRCDLICIGTRGHSELGKVLVGSTATKVTHLSDVPDLLVK